LAIDRIRKTPGYETSKVSVVGFCMGSTILAEAIALGYVREKIDRVVLMTLGLVYQASIDSRLKSEDRALERVKPPIGVEGLFQVDPREGTGVGKRSWAQWTGELADIYRAWPTGLKAHEEAKLPDEEATKNDRQFPSALQIHRLCNRVGFMYGMPYDHRQLVDEIHGSAEPQLYDLFGAIPLHMLMHGAQNLRHGQSSFYSGDTFQGIGSNLFGQTASEPTGRDDSRFLSEDARRAFLSLERVTLVTGVANRLWHRDSIDRMYEWLRRGAKTRPGQIRKHVLAGYAHQDLLWGRNVANEGDVFDVVVNALR
jgi:hypothetical protein